MIGTPSFHRANNRLGLQVPAAQSKRARVQCRSIPNCAVGFESRKGFVLIVATVPIWGYLQRTEPSDGRSMTRGRMAAAVFLFLAPVTSAFLAVAAIL